MLFEARRLPEFAPPPAILTPRQRWPRPRGRIFLTQAQVGVPDEEVVIEGTGHRIHLGVLQHLQHAQPQGGSTGMAAAGGTGGAEEGSTEQP